MANSHPPAGRCASSNAFFFLKFGQERGEEAMGMSEARKKLVAGLESGKITPATFAPARVTYQIATPRGTDIPTERSGIGSAEVGRDRVRRSSFELPPAIEGSSNVEQWKHIPRLAESRTPALL
jgi:hypothetical protein